jgi:hypothetical protein
VPKFVQFSHPGGEHTPTEGRFVDWNTGEHLRKFMEVRGTWLDNDNKQHVDEMWFWGEWEPESEVIHTFEGGDPRLPRYLWCPFWVRKHDYGLCVNTDPLVFGGFYYSDCRQADNEGLRELLPGSVIIFGSRLEGEWVVDAVFVVAKRAPYDRIFYDRVYETRDLVIPEGYEEVVLQRNCRPYGGERRRTLYVGATFDNQVDGMFSFVPCLPKPQDLRQAVGFRRPAIQLPADYFDPDFWRGAIGANAELTKRTVKDLWQSVKEQVRSQGLCLGISMPFPDKREA